MPKYHDGAHLREAIPLDIEHFAEFQLDANIDYQELALDGSILGMSVFQDLKKSIVREGGAKADIVFPAETIVIDHEALRDSLESRARFTIAHECAHLILHQNIYYRDSLMKYSSQSSYRPFIATFENVRTGTVDRAEFQTNYLGAALLMPRTPFSDAYQRLVPGIWCDLAEWQKKAVINELADTFETSLFATSVRIKNGGLAA
ncbi:MULTISPECIES: ImmA/IrrE family metallo-endopeptidase [Corynebacterium]|uniref:ImmA/IrrE family metallo-endopeptidase n=1 Tax=Corynebacterium TaxID=1716 RepID=UPI000AD88271|nr:MULTISPECIES: ImmA/IrrE family metallo-endopeptidase [Corynebacterium]